MIGASWLARVRSGGYTNVLIPAHIFLSITFTLSIHDFSITARIKKTKTAIAPTICLLAILQLLILTYNPTTYIPSVEDRKAGEALVSLISKIDGDVLIPYHGYLAGMAGKRIYLQGNSGGDVFRMKEGRIKSDLYLEILKAIKEKKFGAIIPDLSFLDVWTGFWPLFRKEVENGYIPAKPIFSRDEMVFYPMSGSRTRPAVIFIPSTS